MKRFLLIFALFAITLSAQEKEDAGEKNLGWKWANFALLAIGLGYLVRKNLPPVFQSRTEEIQKGIVEAQAMKRDAEKRAAEMQAKLESLGADIEKFRTQARAEMEQESARIAVHNVHPVGLIWVLGMILLANFNNAGIDLDRIHRLDVVT